MALPFGLDRVKPRHYREMARIAWENRDALPYAWRILSRGVCDGCALGTSGLRDWTIPGTHLCMVRLELMRLNTAPALDADLLRDVGPLRHLESRALRALGRLPCPLIRQRGQPGFHAVGWDEALDRLGSRLRVTDPARVAFYLTSRGLTNEVYYAAQKAARALGSPHVDNSARLCHAASTVAMKEMLGHGASTVSYADWLDADLIVFFGSNTPNNQPVTTKYLDRARRNGARIAVVNPLREPGLARYWIPSLARSAVFGTALADEWFDVHTGGDLAFLTGVLRALADAGAIDREFVGTSTTGWDAALAAARAPDWASLEAASGASRARMQEFAGLLAARPNAIFVWSMGLTQHAHGVDTVRALINVALARGLFGRRSRGVMPIRGHSGVQGGAEVGCVPDAGPETRERWRRVWGFDVPGGPGLTADEMVAAAADGGLDVFWMVGGNFLDTLPDRARSLRALGRPALRVHQDIVLNEAMLADPSEAVVLLPATTRYDSPGGGTETSTERRIIFSPEIPGPRIDGARPEWWVFGEVMARARPDRASRVRFEDAAAIRREIAEAVPVYAGIERLAAQGDHVQWGGPLLYPDGRFATLDGRARFVPVRSIGPAPDEPGFRLSTRRGKQFNSMVHRDVDPLTGAARDAVLMSAGDAARLGVGQGSRVRLRSAAGTFDGRVHLAPILDGNVEVHWPEGQVLLPVRLDPQSREPDYNARVTIERVG